MAPRDRVAYSINGVEVPPLAPANGYLEELGSDFEISDEEKLEELSYAVLREHIRKPPGIMADMVGAGWSEEAISVKEADALARWVVEDAPEAEEPGDFHEPEAAHDNLSELREEFPILPEDEQLPVSEGEKLFERSCGPCHESKMAFAGPPSVPEPGEEVPPLTPRERAEEGLELQTYYNFREHIRKPPKLMSHYVSDVATGKVGYSKDVFSEGEADAISRFIALNEGEADSLDEETGLPPGYNEEAPTNDAEAGQETPSGESGQTGEETGAPGFTFLAAALTLVLAARMATR